MSIYSSHTQEKASASRYFSAVVDGQLQVIVPASKQNAGESSGPLQQGWTWSSAELCCQCQRAMEPGTVCYLDRKRVCKQCYRDAVYYHEVKDELDGQAVAVAVCVGLATVVVIALAGLWAGL